MRETPGAYRPNQYDNPANPAAHEATTGPEIWRQTDGRITHFVAGAGTGGTLTGVGRYLKSRNPAVRIVAADPEGSVYSGGSGRPYLVEGIGEDFWPATYDPSVVDEVHRRLRPRLVPHGPPGGPGGGPAHRRFLRHGGGRRPAGGASGARPTTWSWCCIPDSGRGYLSRVFNDEWLARYGFLAGRGHHGVRRPGRPGPGRHPAAGLRLSRTRPCGRPS